MVDWSVIFQGAVGAVIVTQVVHWAFSREGGIIERQYHQDALKAIQSDKCPIPVDNSLSLGDIASALTARQKICNEPGEGTPKVVTVDGTTLTYKVCKDHQEATLTVTKEKAS